MNTQENKEYMPYCMAAIVTLIIAAGFMCFNFFMAGATSVLAIIFGAFGAEHGTLGQRIGSWIVIIFGIIFIIIVFCILCIVAVIPDLGVDGLKTFLSFPLYYYNPF